MALAAKSELPTVLAVGASRLLCRRSTVGLTPPGAGTVGVIRATWGSNEPLCCSFSLTASVGRWRSIDFDEEEKRATRVILLISTLPISDAEKIASLRAEMPARQFVEFYRSSARSRNLADAAPAPACAAAAAPRAATHRAATHRAAAASPAATHGAATATAAAAATTAAPADNNAASCMSLASISLSKR